MDSSGNVLLLPRIRLFYQRYLWNTLKYNFSLIVYDISSTKMNEINQEIQNKGP